MSIKVTLNCKVQEDQFGTLLPFLNDNLARVRGFAGCRQVNVFFDREKDELLLDEMWVSAEHHQQYIEFISANGVMGGLASFLQGPPDIKYFDVVDV
ncbi:antibiotic biosynthesis monooxygenase [Gammaproteobacteria bacterium 42_54_T18]|nr:antibiotic biosynthesis monooxygenase [Gammaproteobacteria bacterium 42_54_T18]